MLGKVGQILVVDDEQGVCALIADILEPDGFAVACARSDRDAYATLRRDTASLGALIVDINLGRGTTGFDVAREARSHAPRLPVVFISGDDGGSVERFGVSGAVFLRKPFLPDELSAAVHLAIANMA